MRSLAEHTGRKILSMAPQGNKSVYPAGGSGRSAQGRRHLRRARRRKNLISAKYSRSRLLGRNFLLEGAATPKTGEPAGLGDLHGAEQVEVVGDQADARAGREEWQAVFDVLLRAA